MPWLRLAVLLCLALTPALSQAADPRVDPLSTRLIAELAASLPEGATTLRPLPPLADEPQRARITAIRLAAPAADCDQIEVTVERPGTEVRLLWVDIGLVLLADELAYVPLPHQRVLLTQPTQTVTLEVLPLTSKRPGPAPGTPLKAALSNQPGVLAVLNLVWKSEAEDLYRLARYVETEAATPAVDTIVTNRDVLLARWMTWSKNEAGVLTGRVPREPIRIALWAVTEGFTIQETADWLRLEKGLDMAPAIAEAQKLAEKTELILERAGLNFRVFSAAHADFHLANGVEAFRRTDLARALEAFGAAADKAPNSAAGHYNRGITLYRMGKYVEASEAFLLASGVSGADAEVFYNRGATLYRLGDKLGAARAFRRALAQNPRHPEASKWLAKADPEGRTDEKKGKGKGKGKPAKTKPIEAKPIEAKPIEAKPIEAKPIEAKPIEQKPVEQKPVEQKPVEQKPVEQKPIEQKPVEQKPIEQKPLEEAPAAEKGDAL